MPMKTLLLIPGMLLLAAGSPAMAGAGLLFNPFFDNAEALDGWTINANRIAEWDSLDEEGLSASGSAKLTHDIDGNNGVTAIMHQCVAVQPHQAYYFGASVLWPDGQPEDSGRGRLLARVYSEPGCSGSSDATFTPPLDPDGQWQFTQAVLTTGASARSARIHLSIQKFSGITQDLTAHFDNVFMFSDRVFADGFELE